MIISNTFFKTNELNSMIQYNHENYYQDLRICFGTLYLWIRKSKIYMLSFDIKSLTL